jgi:hypothetical protein
MKYKTLAAAFMVAAAPASAMTIDQDERELYDDSIQCMAFYGIMAKLGDGNEAEDAAALASGTKFLAVATALADEDNAQIQTDLNAQMKMFGELAERPDDAENLAKLSGIKDSCEFLETLVDAMIDGSS